MIEVFKFWVRYRYEGNKEWKGPKIGDDQGTPRWYSRKIQATKLGDAPEGIPSFVSNIIGNLTWSYIFIHNMICVLLGASFSFVRIFLMLLIIMFCIYIFNKNVKDSLYHAYFTCIHVAVLKTESLPLLQKFPRKVREWYNVETFCILSSDKSPTV